MWRFASHHASIIGADRCRRSQAQEDGRTARCHEWTGGRVGRPKIQKILSDRFASDQANGSFQFGGCLPGRAAGAALPGPGRGLVAPPPPESKGSCQLSFLLPDGRLAGGACLPAAVDTPRDDAGTVVVGVVFPRPRDEEPEGLSAPAKGSVQAAARAGAGLARSD